jgi:hypothetical protein
MQAISSTQINIVPKHHKRLNSMQIASWVLRYTAIIPEGNEPIACLLKSDEQASILRKSKIFIQCMMI